MKSKPSSRHKPLPWQVNLAARKREMERQSRMRKQRGLMLWCCLLALFAVAAMFVYLKTAQSRDPDAAELEVIVATAVKPAAVVEDIPPSPAVAEEARQENLDSEETETPATEITRLQPAVQPATEPLGDEPPLLLTGMDSSREAAQRRDRELLEKVIDHGAWDAYRTLLAESLQAGIGNVREGQGLGRFDSLWQQPVLYRALLRWKFLDRFPEIEITRLVTDRYSAGFLLWLMDRSEAMEELLMTLHEEDDAGAVLKFLKDAWSENEDLYEKYFPLAVACAVVFDRTIRIPHPLGDAEYGAQAVVNPLERYVWYVRKNEGGKLTAPVHRSSARDLVWVVCAPVTTSELEWAISKLRMHRKRWGTTFGMVEYLMERAVEGLNPYAEYSFAEILKHGGVCGDQSYFCVNTARAHGIPAMILSGETSRGGHAWAALKIDSRAWSTNIGRIGGVSKGQAVNPQTGGRITEQEVLHWNERSLQSPATTIKVWRHLWLADFFADIGEEEPHAQTIRLANRIGGSFTETWEALFKVLARETELTGDPPEPANLEDWKSFAADMRRQFRDNPRMAGLAATAESEYIFPYLETGDVRRTLLRERRRIDRNAGEQADLIATSLKREADLLHKQGGNDAKRDIGRLYGRALRDYGGSITGFKTMAGDYFGFMRDDPASARKAARDIELAFNRVVETGNKEWFRANTEASIYRMICGYYREAGDTRRAEMLERRMELLLRRAKRGAL